MRNKYKLASIVALVSSVFIAGCDSSKDASKENFKDAIDKYESKQCIDLGVLAAVKFPETISFDESKLALEDDKKIFDELAKIGVLDKTNSKRPRKDMFGHVSGEENIYVYTLTDLGKKSYSDKDEDFCIGHYSVDEVVNYTEPTDSEWEGGKISRVNYTKSPIDVADWAKKLVGNDNFPSLKRALSEHQESKTMLILKNDGWHDAHNK